MFCLKNASAKKKLGISYCMLCRIRCLTTRPQFVSHDRFATAFDPENKAMTVKHISELSLPKPNVDGKTYAVLISLCHVDGVASLLYTLRSPELKNHSGQVSFPGGACDSTDRDVIHAALRETEEEIGIPQNSVDVWAVMPPIARDPYKPIYPIVGNLGNLIVSDLKHNRQEVSKVFTVPLEFLCDRLNYRYTVFNRLMPDGRRWVYVNPVFLTSPRVWGLTAIATELFLSCMFPDLFPNPYGRFLPT